MRQPSRERVTCPGRRGRDCVRVVQSHTGLAHLGAKLGQLVIHQRPQLDHLVFDRCAPFPLHPELYAVLVSPHLRLGELGPEYIHQLAQRCGFPVRLYGRLSDRLYARLYGQMNGRAWLLALWKLDQGPPIVPALVTPAQAPRPLADRLGRDAQPLAGLLVGQPLPCDVPTLRPFMLSGLSDRTYGLMYGLLFGLQTDSLELGRARTHDCGNRR